MHEQLRKDLAAMVGSADWHTLIPHAARDSLVIVHAGLDLVDVGVAVATDNVNSVQRWISEALITKPTVEQLENWERDRTQQFQTLIVQPYVLIQDLPADEAS